MTRSLAATALPLLLVFSTSSLEAGQVTVKGAHLCCAACQGRAEKALEGLKGVSKKSVDRNAKVISFFAADEQAVTTGIAALAKSGFYGVTSHGKKPVQFPDSGAKRGVRSDKVLLMGVHLCCDACVVGAQVATQNIKGLTAIEIDRETRTLRLIGKSISHTEAVTALNKGGFYGRLPVAKKK